MIYLDLSIHLWTYLLLVIRRHCYVRLTLILADRAQVYRVWLSSAFLWHTRLYPRLMNIHFISLASPCVWRRTASIRNLTKSPGRCVYDLLKSQLVRLAEHLPLMRRADMTTSPTRHAFSLLWMGIRDTIVRIREIRCTVRVRRCTLESVRDRNEQDLDHNLDRDSFSAPRMDSWPGNENSITKNISIFIISYFLKKIIW